MIAKSHEFPVILSMLHEPAERNSATRRFRGRPVLAWTLQRLARGNQLGPRVVVCWDDQLPDAQEAVASAGQAPGAAVVSRGAREAAPNLDAVAAARHWSDGWRGGLLGTCAFDAGFHAATVGGVMDQYSADAVALVDPAAGLVDAELVDAVVAHAHKNSTERLCFSPAAPGLAAAVVRRSLVTDLGKASLHPGKLLHYLPDQPVRDPISEPACAATPTPVARSVHSFLLNSERQLDRLSAATGSLNGQLISTDATSLAKLLDQSPTSDAYPREVTLELTTRRATSPLWWPGRHLSISRPDMMLDTARRLFDDLAGIDDLRLTLGGVGDPLLSDAFYDILGAARDAGLRHVHVETDLASVTPHDVPRLAGAPMEVLSIHLPAVTAGTYTAVMGGDHFVATLQTLAALVSRRHALGRGTPLLVPVFTKCAENLAEMEPWYDQWLRLLGSAVIRGPSDCAGQIPATSLADMAPPRRRPCQRIASRMTVLSDGQVVSCDEDVLARNPLGQIGQTSVLAIWQRQFAQLRDAHQKGRWDFHPLCRSCKEWHRP